MRSADTICQGCVGHPIHMDITKIAFYLGLWIKWTAKSDIQKQAPDVRKQFNEVTENACLIAFRYVPASGAIMSYFGCTEPPK